MPAAPSPMPATRASLPWSSAHPLPPPTSWSPGHVGFADVLADLNPLQYLPGVGMLYRAITGDRVHPGLQIAVAGAASLLFGGPIGLVATMLIATATEIARTGTLAPAIPPAAFGHATRAYARTAANG